MAPTFSREWAGRALMARRRSGRFAFSFLCFGTSYLYVGGKSILPSEKVERMDPGSPTSSQSLSKTLHIGRTHGPTKLIKLERRLEVLGLEQPVRVLPRDVETEVHVPHQEHLVPPLARFEHLGSSSCGRVGTEVVNLALAEVEEDALEVLDALLVATGMRGEVDGDEEQSLARKVDRRCDAALVTDAPVHEPGGDASGGEAPDEVGAGRGAEDREEEPGQETLLGHERVVTPLALHLLERPRSSMSVVREMAAVGRFAVRVRVGRGVGGGRRRAEPLLEEARPALAGQVARETTVDDS